MERPTQTSLEVMQDKGYKQEKQLNFSKNAIILKKWKEYANYLETEIQELKKGAVESKKVVIPKFAADYIEASKSDDLTLLGMFDNSSSNLKVGCKFSDWCDTFSSIDDFQKVMARAWDVGYEVEREHLYEVVFNSCDGKKLLWHSDMPVYGGTDIISANRVTTGKTVFTEKEIKAIDERYWAFRVPVEEEK